MTIVLVVRNLGKCNHDDCMQGKCISARSFCSGLERKLLFFIHAFHTQLVICPTLILISSSATSPYFQKCVSVCILMYWTVHKNQDVLFYLQDVSCFISYVYAFIFGYKINLLDLQHCFLNQQLPERRLFAKSSHFTERFVKIVFCKCFIEEYWNSK